MVWNTIIPPNDWRHIVVRSVTHYKCFLMYCMIIFPCFTLTTCLYSRSLLYMLWSSAGSLKCLSEYYSMFCVCLRGECIRCLHIHIYVLYQLKLKYSDTEVMWALTHGDKNKWKLANLKHSNTTHVCHIIVCTCTSCISASDSLLKIKVFMKSTQHRMAVCEFTL